MAKSSLDFIDRINVKTLANPIIQLSKSDCGRVILLNDTRGHEITLPTIAEANDGWHARFVVGTVQNDITDRFVSKVIAQAGDTISLSHNIIDIDGAASTHPASAAAVDEALAIDAIDGDNEGFILTVTPAAGGSGAPITFQFLADDAAVDAATAAPNTFFISRAVGDGDPALNVLHSAIIAAMINGTDPAAIEEVVAADFKLPPDGTPGSATNRDANWLGEVGATVTNTTKITLTMTANAHGALAPAGVSLAHIAGTDGVVVDALGDNNWDTQGAPDPGISLSGQEISFNPSGSVIGDIVKVELVNGAWRCHAISAS